MPNGKTRARRRAAAAKTESTAAPVPAQPAAAQVTAQPAPVPVAVPAPTQPAPVPAAVQVQPTSTIVTITENDFDAIIAVLYTKVNADRFTQENWIQSLPNQDPTTKIISALKALGFAEICSVDGGDSTTLPVKAYNIKFSTSSVSLFKETLEEGRELIKDSGLAAAVASATRVSTPQAQLQPSLSANAAAFVPASASPAAPAPAVAPAIVASAPAIAAPTSSSVAPHVATVPAFFAASLLEVEVYGRDIKGIYLAVKNNLEGKFGEELKQWNAWNLPEVQRDGAKKMAVALSILQIPYTKVTLVSPPDSKTRYKIEFSDRASLERCQQFIRGEVQAALAADRQVSRAAP